MPRVVIRETPVVDTDMDRALLDDVELTRISRKGDPAAFTAAHALKRRVIGEQLGVGPSSLRFARRCATCGSDRHGKPSIVGHPEWSFSLSYTTRLAVVALTDVGGVGVDIESVEGADHTEFDKVTLAREEAPGLARYAGHDLAVARATVWSRKEAILKATGHGLVVDPSEIVVSGPGESAALLQWRAAEQAPDAIDVHDLVLEDPSHRGAVAVLTADHVEIVHGT